MDIVEQKDYIIMLQAQHIVAKNPPPEDKYIVCVVARGLYEPQMNYRKPENDNDKAVLQSLGSDVMSEAEIIMVNREKALELANEFKLIGADFNPDLAIIPVLRKIEDETKEIEHVSFDKGV